MRDPTPLSEAISQFISKRGLAARRSTSQIADAWKRASGERIAASSRYLCTRDRTVFIGVFNSALLTELVSFHAATLLAKLQAECPNMKIDSIRFQLKTQNNN